MSNSTWAKLRKWKLISGRFSDGCEILVLKNPDEITFCAYAPGRKPYEHLWNSYYSGFPKQEFPSRESCIANANEVAGQNLVVESLKPLRRVAS